MVNKASLKKVFWSEISAQFHKINPELAKIIDDLSPSKKLFFYEATYPYGAVPIQKGKLFLPSNTGDLVSIDDPFLDKEVKKHLSYNIGTNPVSIVLRNNFEITLIINNHIIPLYGLIPPGKIFSTSRILSTVKPQTPAFLWNMTSGARSIFMLPKISEARSNLRLKKRFNLTCDAPHTLLAHWKVFKEISNHSTFENKWESKILYFSKEWFEHLNDKKWAAFHNYLFQSAWNGSEFWRNKFIWDVMFSMIKLNNNLTSDVANMDIVKHLFTLAIGMVPGFYPAFDEESAPIKELQKTYIEIYKVPYAPIIMLPYYLNEKQPIYYSLDYPCTLEFSANPHSTINKIVILNDLIYLIKKCQSALLEADYNIHDTLLYEAAKKVKFDFYHHDVGNYTGIKFSGDIEKEDPSFITKSPLCTGMNFPNNSSFFRGCIKITKN